MFFETFVFCWVLGQSMMHIFDSIAILGLFALVFFLYCSPLFWEQVKSKYEMLRYEIFFNLIKYETLSYFFRKQKNAGDAKLERNLCMFFFIVVLCTYGDTSFFVFSP